MQSSHDLLPDTLVELVALRFRALAEPTRLRLLERLRAGETPVRELIELTGSSQQNVSRHLAVLVQAGIVGRRRERGRLYYRIVDAGVVDLCDRVCEGVQQHVTELSRLLGAGRAVAERR